MLGRVLFGASVLLALPIGVAGAQTTGISLRDAFARALTSHPDLHAAEAEVAVARGERVIAHTNPYNPSVVSAFGPALRNGTTVSNYQFGISQPVELGGKASARQAIAEARQDAAQAQLDRQRQVVGWRAYRSFYLALIARDRLDAAIDIDSVGVAIRIAAADRLSLGKGTQLELNVATVAAARDRRTRTTAARDLATALLEFRASLGAAPEDSIAPIGAIPRLTAPTAPLAVMTTTALQLRMDFQAVRSTRHSADASVRFARALAWPDPGVGIATGRDDDTRLTTFSISLPLPLWNRGQGNRAVAIAELDRARVAEDSTMRMVQREVADAYQAFQAALVGLAAFDTDIIERLTENLGLARESFEAGKISLYTYNTIRRDLVEARLGYLDALTELISRRYALALAAGESWEGTGQ